MASTEIWYLYTGRLVPVNEEEGYDETYKTGNTIGKNHTSWALRIINKNEKYKSKFGESAVTTSSDQASSKSKDKFGTVDKSFSLDSSNTKSLNKVFEDV